MNEIIVKTRDDIRVKISVSNEVVCIDIGQCILYTVQHKDITLRSAKHGTMKERIFSISADSLYISLSETDINRVSEFLDILITIFDE